MLTRFLTHVTFDAHAAFAALATQQAGHKMTGADPGNRLQAPAGYAMTAPIHPARRFTAPSTAPGTQQKRSIFSLAPNTFKGKELEHSLSNFRSIIRENIPDLHTAEFSGFHGTSARNMCGIVANGFDTRRSGANFKGFSLHGPGLYVAQNPYLALAYGEKAAGHGETVQLLAVFRQPDAVGAQRTASKDEAWEIYEDGTINKRISPDALASDETSFVGVPLPPIPADRLQDAMTWLAAGLQDDKQKQE